MRLGMLSSHPIQYQAPLFRALAKFADLDVYFSHQPTLEEQGSGFGKRFRWDIDLVSGYRHQFLKNRSSGVGMDHFFDCDTPEIARIIAAKRFDAFIVS